MTESRREVLWAIARWSALLATPVLLVLLVLSPKPTLTALWYVVIPILPASFFLSPALWRGLCPLATLNEWGNRLGRPASLSPRSAEWLGLGGLVLFHLMVPARRVLFNQNGAALAITVAGVAGLAIILGAVFVSRAAFCNALCPVLPVELLYGQRPLLSIRRGRCAACTVCTPRGCLDLSERKAIRQVLGPTWRTREWLATPFGVFAGALSGFIVGYNLVKDTTLASTGMIYAATLGGSLISYLLTVGVVFGLRLDTSKALGLVAAAAGALYYWFAGPAIAGQLHLNDSAASAIRAAGIGTVATWLILTLRSIESRQARAEG